jgi:hypothetical protein
LHTLSQDLLSQERCRLTQDDDEKMRSKSQAGSV